MDIRLIKPEELEYNQESFIMETPSSKVYKGQFGGFTVAIKKYLDPLTSPGYSLNSKPTKQPKNIYKVLKLHTGSNFSDTQAQILNEIIIFMDERLVEFWLDG